MGSSKQLIKVTVTSVILLALSLLHSGIPVSLRRPRTSKTIQQLRFRQDSIEHAPLNTRVTLAASNHTEDGARIAPQSNCSGNATGQHIKQSHYDLEDEFERRHRVLLRGCIKYDGRVINPRLSWRASLKHVLPGPLTLVRVPKAGSSALRELIAQVQNMTPTTPRPLSAVVVRHPLARLASAYRDKFLNGKSLSEYDDEWRNVTQSLENWDTRFKRYWLPALVSEGFLHRNREFNKTLNKIRKAYQVYINNYVSQSGALLAFPSTKEDLFYGVEEMKTAYFMLFNGPHSGFSKAFRNCYNLTDLVQRYRTASFTFNQFLHHVVWTHDLGMPDAHWMTYTETWDPCRMKFDYILKLETIQEELHHLLCGVLGFQEEVSFPVKHRSYGHALGHSDRKYYANVSRELMDRLLDIYKHDFAIFGYSHDL